MSEVINLNNIEQLDSLQSKIKTGTVTLKSKDGKKVSLNLCELDITEMLEYQELVSAMSDKDEINKRQLELVPVFYKIIAKCMINDKSEKICTDSESWQKLKRIFDINEAMKAVTVIFNISGTSQESSTEIEKN